MLVDRVRSQAPTDRLDAIVALLRLAPEHRVEALEAASSIDTELGAALRHSLGGMEAVGADAALWYAAARARAPLEDDAAIDGKHPNGGPDGALAARYAIDLARFPDIGRGAFSALVGDRGEPLRIEPAMPEHPLPDRFPALWHFRRHAFMRGQLSAWESSLWPICRAPVFAREARQLAVFLDSQGSYWKGDWEPLFDPDEPLGVPGTLLIVLGLGARHASHNKLAEDALIASIDDGRLDVTLLASAMAAVLQWGALTLGRWTRAFAEVARVSAIHLQVMQAAVAGALGEAAPSPATVRPLVELLREWAVESGEPVGDLRCRDWLATISGTGKLAVAARALLAPRTTAPLRHRRDAGLRALATRIRACGALG